MLGDEKMRAIFCIGFSAAMVAPQMVIAKPTYLECNLPTDKGASAITLDVTVNEEAGVVSFVARQTGWAPSNMMAIFSPSDVRFGPSLREGKYPLYKIDRVTLDFSEHNKVGEDSFWRRGKCTVKPKVHAQF